MGIWDLCERAPVVGKRPHFDRQNFTLERTLKVEINPLFGTGFESFWLGERFQKFAESRWWQPNRGSQWLSRNLFEPGTGWTGFADWLLIATFWKGRRELLTNFQFGRFRLGFLIAVVAYNWTEAAFKNISAIWFVFCIIALDYSAARIRLLRKQKPYLPREQDEKLVYAEGEIEPALLISDFHPPAYEDTS